MIRVISIILGVTCLAAAIALHSKPTQPARLISSPSTAILISHPLPDADEELLDRHVSRVDFTNAPLETVTRQLSEMESAPISIEWEGPDDLRWLRYVAVTIHLKDASLKDAFRAVIENLASQGYHDIDFDAVDQRIQIGPSNEIRRRTQTEYFNVRALLGRLIENGPWLTDAAAGAGDSVSEQLIQFITRIVDPDSWRVAGGITGETTEIGDVLVVTQTPRNLAAIRLILGGLEQALNARELPPVSVSPTTNQSPSTGNVHAAFFNVRPMMQRLATRSPKVQATDQIRTYIMNHVERTVWTRLDGGGMLWLDGILAVTQARDIQSVQLALEDLARSFTAAAATRIAMIDTVIRIFLALSCIVLAIAFTTRPRPAPPVLVSDNGIVPPDLLQEIAEEDAILDRQVADLNLGNSTLDAAIDCVAAASRTRNQVNWKTLEDAGIARTAAVHVHLHHGALREVLRWIADDVYTEAPGLSYTTHDGTIVFSTADDLSKDATIEIYNIRPLIEKIQASTPRAPDDIGITSEEAVEAISRLLSDTVASDVWKDNGGSVGSIREMNGLLIITQTRQAHREIATLLTRLDMELGKSTANR